jgi:F-type H+-transporting ATPase subunit gamma
MPESLKVLRRRIRSISNTKQVTRAMEMVSAAKLRRAQGALLSARPYVRHLEKLLAHVAPMAEATGHPLFSQRHVKRSTLVLYTADRGLCGSYNANLIRIAEKHLKDHRLGSMELVCLGKKGHEYFSRRHWPIALSITDMGGVLDRKRSDQLANYLKERFLSGQTDEVFLLYSTFINTAHSRPTYQKFLDLDLSDLITPTHKLANTDYQNEYILEPTRERVFERLLPDYLQSKIYITMAETYTSEHSARMLAMNNASSNCDEMADTLTLKRNKARQGSITNDLLDIVGGAEALQQGN